MSPNYVTAAHDPHAGLDHVSVHIKYQNRGKRDLIKCMVGGAKLMA